MVILPERPRPLYDPGEGSKRGYSRKAQQFGDLGRGAQSTVVIQFGVPCFMNMLKLLSWKRLPPTAQMGKADLTLI